MTSFARRISNIRPEGAYQVLAQAQELERQGRDIVHLEIGQPDFQTFEPICQSGKEAIDAGHTRYTPSAGIRELREAIALRISATKGACSPAEVVVGPGAKPGILFPILALVNPGDEVLYPDPGFPSYRADIELAGGVPVPAPLLEKRNFSFDLDFLAERMGDKTKLLIINSPSNPTGGTIPREDLETIARLAIERDVHRIAAFGQGVFYLAVEIGVVFNNENAHVSGLPGERLGAANQGLVTRLRREDGDGLRIYRVS